MRVPALTPYYRSRWFRDYLLVFFAAFVFPRLFLLLLGASMVAPAPKIAFGPAASATALCLELILIHLATRLRNEHILLANLGLTPLHLFTPFTLTHVTMELTLHGVGM